MEMMCICKNTNAHTLSSSLSLLRSLSLMHTHVHARAHTHPHARITTLITCLFPSPQIKFLKVEMEKKTKIIKDLQQEVSPPRSPRVLPPNTPSLSLLVCLFFFPHHGSSRCLGVTSRILPAGLPNVAFRGAVSNDFSFFLLFCFDVKGSTLAH